MKRFWSLALVAVSSLATRFAFYGRPGEVVLDEVLVGKFVSSYFTHSVVFDSHPALAKLLVAGFAALCGWKPGFSFDHIGQVYPDGQHLVLRFLPALAGALLPVIVWLLARELRFSRLAASTAALLVILDNALLTESRFLLPDPFLLLFGFAALFFYFRSARTGGWGSLLAAAFLGGAAASVKWTGLTFVALPVIVEAVRAIRETKPRLLGRIVTMAAVTAVLYVSVMAVHVRLTISASKTPLFGPTSVAASLVTLNRDMFNANRSLTVTHPYGSSWYTWPLMVRPLYCWNDTMTPPAKGPARPTTERIYLLGNPLVWWGSTLAVAVLLVGLAAGRFGREQTAFVLAGGYIMNFLPFIGISRVMFLYHYFSALIFAILILAYLLDKMRATRWASLAVLAAAAALFLFFSPLSYGLPLGPAGYEARVWLGTWR